MSIIFFGGLGIIAAPRMWRRKVSMVLTPDQIEQTTVFGSAIIPWKDVERVGIVRILVYKLVGLRLRTYNNYLANMSPELAGWMVRSLPVLKLLALGTSVLKAPQLLTLWSKLEGTSDPSEALESLGKVGNLAEMLLWSRDNYGYDITIGFGDLDRSVSDFAALLERYRKNAENDADSFESYR